MTLVLVAIAAIASRTAHADRGVGVTLARIQIDDRLQRGGGYELPVLGVINTGDEPGDYEVMIGHLEDQAELKPDAAWFGFQPKRFFLQPGQVQEVSIRLTLPTGADPGAYFALIEAHSTVEGEGVTIGAAAASSLLFTVEPSSWLDAQRVRLTRFLDDNQTWFALVAAAALLALMIAYLRRYRIHVEVGRR